MIKKLLFLGLLLNQIFLFSQIPYGYYDSAEGLTGDTLKQALHEIIKNHTEKSYAALWDLLKETDKDTNNPNNIILLYTGWSVNAAQEYNGGDGWNREHVWARAHGNFDTNQPEGTDLHHLRPTDVTVNSSRSSLDFDDGGSPFIDGDGATGCFKDNNSFEPRDQVKGDVARMMFYMDVRYEGTNGELDLVLLNTVNTGSASGIGYHGKLSTLIKWHLNDPVDSFEKRRNNIIYNYQNNRNPFIDHPEYVLQIWDYDTTNVSSMNTLIDNSTIYCKNNILFLKNLPEGKNTIEIYAINGQCAMKKQVESRECSFYINKMKTGMFIVRIISQSQVISKKIILQP